jgi:hypothetical protein
VQNLSLELAYARYGAKLTNRFRGLSALAEDGSLVLSCPAGRFSRPGAGVLRYSSQLSEETASAHEVRSLREHLGTALSGGGTVRSVFITAARGTDPRVVHVRTDLIGKVVEFDGDTFKVDFTREQVEERAPARRRR